MSLLIDIGSLIYFFVAISAVESVPLKAIISAVLLLLILFKRRDVPCLTYPPCKYIALFLLFVSLEICISGNYPFQYALSRISLFLPIILFDYYKNDKNGERIFRIVMLIWIAISIRAFSLLYTGVFVPRNVMMKLQESIPFSGGGYALAVGSALLSCYLFDELLWAKDKKKIKIFLIILLSAVVVLTQSSITVIAMFIGYIFSIGLRLFHISSLSKLSGTQVVSVLMLCIVCLLIFFFRENIGSLIMSIGAGKDDILSKRVIEFGFQFSGDDTIGIDASDSEGRFDRMLNSLSTFFKYPILGITSRIGPDYFLQGDFGVGNHSEWFDTFARFGVLAGVPYFASFLTAVIYERKMQIKKIGFGYIAALFFLFVLNPFLYMSSNCVLFFMIPMMTIIRNRGPK